MTKNGRGRYEMNKGNEKKVIFVCTGNTCRSPMAEAIFRYEAKRRGLQGVSVASAGTEASTSGGMHPFSLRTLERNGLTIENFSPSPLSNEMILNAYAVICMTDLQRDVVSYMRWKLLKDSDGAENNVYAFSDFTEYQIPDPYGYGEDAYEQTYAALSRGMDAIFAQLFPVTDEPTDGEETIVPVETVESTETTEAAVATETTEETPAKTKAKKQRKPRAKKKKEGEGEQPAEEGGEKTPEKKKSTSKKKTGTARKRTPKKENE